MNYKVLKKIGFGSNSDVFLAKSNQSDQKIVYKEAKNHLACLQELKNEFQILSRLKHPNLTRVFDYGENPKTKKFFWTCQYSPGQTLDQVRGLSLKEKTDALVQILQGLEYLHSHGLIHLDLKPQNILRQIGGQIKILDLGLSRSPGGDGFFSGTFAYAAPEQILSSYLDSRTDLYAFGVLAFECLTGQRPFLAKNITDMTEQHLYAIPRKASQIEPKLSQEWDPIFDKLLAKKPEHRFSRAFQVIEAINQFSSPAYPVERVSGWEGYFKTSTLQGFNKELNSLMTWIQQKKQPASNHFQQVEIQTKFSNQSKLFLEQCHYALSLERIPSLYVLEEESLEQRLLKFFQKRSAQSREENHLALLDALENHLKRHALIILIDSENQSSLEINSFLTKLASLLESKKIFPLFILSKTKFNLPILYRVFLKESNQSFRPMVLQDLTKEKIQGLRPLSFCPNGLNLSEWSQFLNKDRIELLQDYQDLIKNKTINFQNQRFTLKDPSLKEAIQAISKDQKQTIYLQLANQITEHPDRGHWLWKLDRHQEAKRSLMTYLDKSVQESDYLKVGHYLKTLEKFPADKQILQKLMSCYTVIGDYQKALIASEKLSKQILTKPEQEKNLRRYGWLNLKIQKPEIAIEYYKKALELAKQEKDSKEEASLKNEIGYLLFQSGRGQEAETYLCESFEALLGGEDAFLLSNSRLDIYYSLQGDLEKAWKCFHRKLEKIKRVTKPIVQINLLMTQAYLFQREGQWEDARFSLEEAQKLCNIHHIYTYKETIAQSLKTLGKAKTDEELMMQKTKMVSIEHKKPVAKIQTWQLLDIIQDLNAQTDLKNLLEKILDYAINLTGATRGFLLLKDSESEDETQYQIQATYNFKMKSPQEVPISQTFLRRVFKKGQAMLMTNAQEDQEFSILQSVARFELKSILCVPMILKNKNLGAIYLDNPLEAGSFVEEESQLLSHLAEHAALAIQNVQERSELRSFSENLQKELNQFSKKLADSQEALSETKSQLNQASQHWKTQFQYEQIVGNSESMRRVLQTLDKVTNTPIPILIHGESGTGKELIARALHFNSFRQDQNFITVNCGAIPENLMESEFFGYLKGSFTGADRDHRGYFEQANGGTLFLDEVADLPLSMQVKLLRALQENEIRRIGGKENIAVDFRLLVAANQSLEDLTAKGEFRQDLYYRMAGINIELPPLRDRVEDIPLLVSHFIKEIKHKYQLTYTPKLSSSALEALIHFEWPGNIRQLQHLLTKTVILNGESEISDRDLNLPGRVKPKFEYQQDMILFPFQRGLSWDEYEREFLKQLVKFYDGNKSLAARQLKLARTTLAKKVKN